jgi:hypothetical protein
LRDVRYVGVEAEAILDERVVSADAAFCRAPESVGAEFQATGARRAFLQAAAGD